MSNRRFLAAFASVAALFAVFFYASFFFNFRTTLSEWSGSGFIWPHQLFYNFLHGRPFQSSICATMPAGHSVGFSFNPHPYIHANVIHVNFTPYLFAYLWALHPTAAWLYGLLFLWSLAGMALYTRIILRRLSPRDCSPKIAFALAVLLAGGLLSVLDQMAQFLLFSGPLFMAAYECLLARRRLAFSLLIVALCLFSEDAAMVVATFGVAIFLFEPERRRYAWVCLGTAVPYLLLLLVVVQPAARASLTLTEGTTTVLILKKVLHLSGSALAANLKSMLPALTLLPAFAAAGFLFGWPSKRDAVSIAALAVVPALPHWGESVVVGGGHHLMPPFVFTYLALLRMLGAGSAEGSWEKSRLPPAGWAAALCFLALSLRVSAGNLPLKLRPPLYRLAGKPEKAAALERSLALGMESNREIIQIARSLPPEKSLVYWINNRATGFITARSDLWEFPDYFDRSDYVLVQKDAIDVNYVLDRTAGGDLRSALRNTVKPNVENVPLDAANVRLLVDTLVARERTHRIAAETGHALLLENLHPRPFDVPPETIGFGWTRNLFRRAARSKGPATNWTF